MTTNGEIDDSIRPLLRISRETIERCQKTDYALVSSLERDPLLKERIRRLRTVPGVGPITALSWALEMGDISRFRGTGSGSSEGDGEGQQESGDAGRSAQDGGLAAGRGPGEPRVYSCGTAGDQSSIKTALIRQKQDHRCADCQVLPIAD
jgi:hypothetical protein